MGYDMQFVDDDSEGGYFHLNIWGMGCYVAAMYDLGMVYETKSAGAWPGRPELGEQRDSWFDAACEHLEDGEDLPGDVPADILDLARGHVAMIREFLAEHPAGGDVIPSHKLCSNDGWIVTPAEITAALAVYDALAEDDRAAIAADSRECWAKWIAYLRRAVDHGGFEVD